MSFKILYIHILCFEADDAIIYSSLEDDNVLIFLIYLTYMEQ